MLSTSFDRSKRLHGKRCFEQLFRRGKVFRNAGLALHVIPNGTQTSRFGCVVRRVAAPKAVIRNRVKRWLREAFRRNANEFPGGLDLAVWVHQLPGGMSYQYAEEIIRSLCGRLNPPAG